MKNQKFDLGNLQHFPDKSKQIYYLKDDPVINETESLIIWLYKWCERKIVTPSLHELIDRYYFEN